MEDLIILLIYVASGAVPNNLCILVLHQQTDQFLSGITRRSYNSCFYHKILLFSCVYELFIIIHLCNVICNTFFTDKSEFLNLFTVKGL